MKTIYLVFSSILFLSNASATTDGWMLTVCAHFSDKCKSSELERSTLGFIGDKITCEGKAILLTNSGLKTAKCIECKGFQVNKGKSDSCAKYLW